MWWDQGEEQTQSNTTFVPGTLLSTSLVLIYWWFNIYLHNTYEVGTILSSFWRKLGHKEVKQLAPGYMASDGKNKTGHKPRQSGSVYGLCHRAVLTFGFTGWKWELPFKVVVWFLNIFPKNTFKPALGTRRGCHPQARRKECNAVLRKGDLHGEKMTEL